MIKVKSTVLATIFLILLTLSTNCYGAGSNPEVRHERIKSKYVVDSDLGFSAILPPGYNAAKKYPVLYFLAGASGKNDELIYGEAKLLETYTAMLQTGKIGEFIIVCAESGYNGQSWYVNWKDENGRNYEDYFVKELFVKVESLYSVINSPTARGITGFSMGGYGAYTLALRNPQIFDSISSFAGVLSLMTWVEQSYNSDFLGYERIDDLRMLSPVNLAQNLAIDNPDLFEQKHFYLSVGTNDVRLVYHYNRMVETLDGLKANYTAKIIDDEWHTLDYVAKALPDTLAFHWNIFSKCLAKQ